MRFTILVLSAGLLLTALSLLTGRDAADTPQADSFAAAPLR